MSILLGRVVTVLPTTQVLVKCTQCLRVLHLTAEEHVDEDGDRYADAGPIYRAVGLHQTRGCMAKS